MKKKVLFALIALFSVLSTWAVTDPVIVNDGGTAKYAVLPVDGNGLSRAGLAVKVGSDTKTLKNAVIYEADGVTEVEGNITKVGNYFAMLEGSQKLYPFQVVKNANYTIVKDAGTFDASPVRPLYYAKYPFEDLWGRPLDANPAETEDRVGQWRDRRCNFVSYGSEDGTVAYSEGKVKLISQQNNTAGEVVWSKVQVIENTEDESFVGNVYYIAGAPDVLLTTPARYQLYTSVDGEGALINPVSIWVALSDYTAPGFDNEWLGAINAPGAQYPHADVFCKNEEEGVGYQMVFVYINGEDTIEVKPWGAALFGNGDGLKSWGLASLPHEFTEDVISKIVPATGTTAGVASNFKPEKFSAFLFPAEGLPNDIIHDYSWTLNPISGNYGPDYAGENYIPKYAKVKAYDVNGIEAALTRSDFTFNDVTGKVTTLTVAAPTPRQTYIIRYYDANHKPVSKVQNAGTYYVEVLIYTGTKEIPGTVTSGQDPENELTFMSLGEEEFEVAGMAAELTLMKLEKNFGDPDPVFVDKGVAGWMYKAADGKNKSFYTLKTSNGEVISTDKARLVGVKFQRVDKGEEVYTSSGLGSYSYTVPLTGLKIISPACDPHGTNSTYTDADWETVKLNDPTTYTENYQILNGSFEKLHIVPRDLALLQGELEADDVVYNGAEFTEINKMDVHLNDEGELITPDADPLKVNVTGLFFTTTDGKEIQFDPNDEDNFEVTVTEGDDVDNVNVTREDGVVAPGASLTITAKPETNFTGSVTVPFTINPRNLGDFDLLADFLTAKEVTPATNPVSYVPNPIKGEFTVSLTGDTEYTGEAVKPEFSVLDKNRKDSTTPVALHSGETGDDAHADDYTFVYGGENVNVVREDGTIEDKATITITGVGNYCGTRVYNYGVQPIDITDWDVELVYNDFTEAEIANEGYIYDGNAKKPTPKVSKTTGTGDNATTITLTGDDYDVTYENNIHASELNAKVIITGKGNYKGTVVNDAVYFGIDQNELTVTADNAQKSYGENDPKDFTWTITGWQKDDAYKLNSNTELTGKYVDKDNANMATDDPAKAADSELKAWLDGEIEISRAGGEDNGEYAITVTGPANTGEFEGDAYNDYKITYKAGTFAVGRLGLTITPDEITRFYGDDLAPAEGESYTYTITGWNGDDAATQEAKLRADLAEAGLTIAPVNGPAYTIGLWREKLSITSDLTQFGNYLLTYHYGDIRITAPEVTIAPENITIKYGQKPDYKILNGDKLPVEIDKTKISFKAYTTDEDGELVEIKIDDAGYVREDVGNYVIKTTVAGLGDDNKLGNYLVTVGEGTLTVEPRPVTVRALPQEVDYDDELKQTKWELDPAEPTHYASHTVNHPADADHTEPWTETIVDAVEAGLMSDDLLGNNVKYKDNKGILIRKDPTAPSATKVGETYEKIIEPYIEDQNPNYVITKEYGDLTIKVGHRIALHLNRPYLGTNYDPAKDYAENGTLWDEEKPGELVSDRVYDETLEGDDPETARDNFRFSNITYVYDEDEQVEIESEIEIPNTADQLLRDFDGQTVKVHFGDFNIYKDRWYTLVLPFDTKVSDVSKAFGYAVIDVLDVTNTDKTTVRFKQYIHEIPANTPFLIKVPEDINMKDVVFFAHKEYEEVPVLDPETEKPVIDPETEEPVTETKLVDKHGYEIKYKSEAQMKAAAEAYDAAAAAATASATNIPAAIKDVAGNMIIGTYLGKYGLTKNKETTIGNSGVSLLKKSAVEKAYIYPFGAYFRVADETAEGNIRLVIEEADGTLTVIDAVELAGAAEAEFAEGWYTITGIKLTSEPTVTGTYIYNGKKVFFQAK